MALTMLEQGAPSSFLKLVWAQRHLMTLKESVRRFEEGQPAVITPEFHPKRPGYDLRFHVTQAPPQFISLMTGDVIGCLRDALDHLIFELTVHHTGTPAALDTAWPVCTFKSEWSLRGPKGRVNKRSGEWKTRGIHPRARGFVYRYQPIYRKRTPGPHLLHALWALDEWRNLDRHRRLTLAPVTATGFRASFEIRRPGVEVVRRVTRKRVGQDGDVIERIWLTPGATEAEVSVQAMPVCQLAVYEPSINPRPVRLIGSLEWFAAQVQTVLETLADFEPAAVQEYFKAAPWVQV